MLVLSRARGERIIIGDDVAVAVVDIRGASVRLGVDAPTETTIHREEIYRSRLEAMGWEGGGSHCPDCRTPYELFQPDPDRPSRILGVCPGCGAWARLDLEADGTIRRATVPGMSGVHVR